MVRVVHLGRRTRQLDGEARRTHRPVGDAPSKRSPKDPRLPLPGSAQVSCHPNIFGGQDCTSPEGHSSTPNVFGGYDTTFPDGSRSSSRPNIFGGEDATTPKGTIESRPNIFGGKDYRLPSGEWIESHPNIFGGRDFRHPTVTSWSAVRTSSAARIAANEAPRLRDGSTPGQS